MRLLLCSCTHWLCTLTLQQASINVLKLLTAVWPRHLGLQLLDLFNQQRDVLQQVFVLQQQLVDSSLGLQPSRGLRTQLVLQQVDLYNKTCNRSSVYEHFTMLIRLAVLIYLNDSTNTQIQHTTLHFKARSDSVSSFSEREFLLFDLRKATDSG